MAYVRTWMNTARVLGSFDGAPSISAASRCPGQWEEVNAEQDVDSTGAPETSHLALIPFWKSKSLHWPLYCERHAD